MEVMILTTKVTEIGAPEKLALKARNDVGGCEITVVLCMAEFRAFSASWIHSFLPGALPQAITFRAFGAEQFFALALHAEEKDFMRRAVNAKSATRFSIQALEEKMVRDLTEFTC